MNNSNENLSKGKTKMAAVVLCAFLFAVLMLVAFIHWPRGRGINIGEEGIEHILQGTNDWYFLEKDSYKILNEFGEHVTRHSTFYYPIRYYYFNVEVTDSKETTFVMAVRTHKKTEELRSEKAVSLYGRVASLDQEQTNLQSRSLDSSQKIYSICLNDNDETISGRYIQSVLAIILGLLDLILILFILKR